MIFFTCDHHMGILLSDEAINSFLRSGMEELNLHDHANAL